MRAVTYHICEICGSEYTTSAQAAACEALGLPTPMPFLPWDRSIPAFGETIQFARLHSLEIRRNWLDGTVDLADPATVALGLVKHVWWVETTPRIHVSRYIDDRRTPAIAFDPRHGHNAFQCSKSTISLRIWEDAMREYGFSEVDASENTLCMVQQIRQGLP